MEFLKQANLPHKRVRGVLVDYRIGEESILNLESCGIKVFFSCKVNGLYTSVGGHPDMMITHIEENKFVCEPSVYEYYNELFSDIGAEVIKGKKIIKSTYPDDVAYNIAILENIVIHKSGCTDDTIICHIKKQNKILLDVNQGYSKCNTCIISNNAVITEDASIERALRDTDIDVLKITSGSIKLDGMSHGFLGGATGLIDRDMLAVNGNLKTHPDGKLIEEFCEKHDVKVICLTEKQIEDIGSIIPIYY